VEALITLLVAASVAPCLPDELGHHAPAGALLAAPVAPVTSPAPAVAPPPVSVAATAAPAPGSSGPTGVGAPARPPLPLEESARFRLTFGLLGDLGEIQLGLETLSPDAAGKRLVRATGSGKGSVLGLGETERRLETDLDPASPVPRRWTSTRVQGGKTTVDSNDVPRPGKVVMVRRRAGRPDDAGVLRRPRPIVDPLTFLLRLRASPPRKAESFEILDGRALWLVTVQPAERARLDGSGGPPALRLEGRAQPLEWDGSSDPERPARSFVLWLDEGAYHAPLRLTMSLPLGQLRVERVALSQPGATGGVALHRLWKWLPAAAQRAATTR
jgi:hypothetical protein